MASIHKTAAGYAIHWRYASKQFQQSAGTKSRAKAEIIAGRVDETIQALTQGWLKLPDGADYATVKRFIFTRGASDGQERIEAPTAALTLSGLFTLYRESLPSNEGSTLYTEAIHERHLTRIIGEDKPVGSISFGDVQSYSDARKRGYRGGKRAFKPVGPSTINKELKTLGKIWSWGVHRGHLAGPKPWQTKNLDLGRAVKRERFRDFDEISEIVRDGGLTVQEQARYWACLYLRGPDLVELLDHVQAHSSAPFIYPMFALCALTGCRRSEAIRALKRDVDFKGGIVTIREKKRDHTQDYTTRDVPMNARLASALRAWIDAHPGGQHLLCDEDGTPITIRSGRLDREYDATLKESRFRVMPGWHTLRHSFASILASKGIDQRVINKFMGHLDEKTVERYRHLYRETGRDAVESLLLG
jgi:integrase